jgi:hypothetical protein
LEISVMFVRTFAVVLALAGLSGASAMEREALDAELRLSPDRVSFQVEGRYTNFTLTISGPAGYLAQAQAARSAPTVRLADYGDAPDGLYTFDLNAATDRIAAGAGRIDHAANGREPGAGSPRVGAYLSGNFRVVDGRIAIFEQLEEPSE